jgi:hypothetical protein
MMARESGPITIVPYAAVHVPAVLAFNARVDEGGIREAHGIKTLLAETNTARRWSPESGRTEEAFLAVDGDTVRGGYVLERQAFLLNREIVSIGLFRHPMSEGAIDKRYSLVGPRLLRDALRREPLLYGAGIGGYEVAAARLLKTARFHLESVPFYFRVEHASRFLREIRLLRSSRLRRFASDAGAATGLGALGILVVQRLRAGGPRARPGVSVSEIDSFDGWADAVWAAASERIDFAAVRDAAVLTALYDTPDDRFINVAITAGGEPCGWAVCLATDHRDNKHFGNLKVGSIVDCLAKPGYERSVVQAAVERLKGEEVDLIVTNQLLPVLGSAFRLAGFVAGPSNYLFAASPNLKIRLQSAATGHRRIHIDRGDGDGPANL